METSGELHEHTLEQSTYTEHDTTGRRQWRWQMPYQLKKTERRSGWVEWVRLVIVPLVLPELEGFSHSAASTCKLTIINISLTRPTDQTRRVGGTLPHLCQWLHLIHAYRTPSWCIWAHVVLTLRRSVYHWSACERSDLTGSHLLFLLNASSPHVP